MKGLLKPLAAATLIALTACGAEKSTEEYLASAEQYLTDGNKDAAVIELKNALRQTSNNTDARTLLGDIYYEKGLYPAAEKEYSKALQDGADRNELVPKLAQTYYKSMDVKKINKLANKYPGLNAEAASTLASIQALCALKDGSIDEAQELLNQAEQKQADNIYAQLGRATLNVSTEQLAKEESQIATALASVEDVIKKAPDTMEAHLLRGHLLMAQNKYAEAEESYRTATDLAAGSPQYRIYLIQSLMKQKKFDEAEPVIKPLLEISPNHPLLNQYMAQILYTREEYQQAKIHADTSIQNGSESASNFIVAGVAALKENQQEQAYRYFSKVQSALPENHAISRIFAYLQLQLGYTDDAVDTLSSLTGLTPDDADLFSTATAKLAKAGNNEQALLFAEKAATLDDSGASDARLGILKLANDDASGLEDLSKALDDNPELTEARLALVYNQLKQGKSDEALASAQAMIQQQPENPRGYTLKGLVEQHLGDTTAAMDLYDQALSLEPNDGISLLSKANLLILSGQSEEGFELQKKNIAANFTKIYVVHNFMVSANKLNKKEQGQALINDLWEKHSDSANLSWAQALYLAQESKFKEAIQVLEALKPEKQDARILELQGELYLKDKQLEQAETTYQKLLTLRPKSPKPYQYLVAVNEMQFDFPNAVKYASEGKEKFPDNQVFKLLEPSMLYKAGRVQAAKRELDMLTSPLSESPVALRLQAKIAMQEKRYDDALQYWQSAHDKAPTERSLVGIASVLSEQGKNQQAIELLEKEKEEFPSQVTANLKLGDLYISTQPKKALSAYEAVLVQAPDNVIALNNASWLLIDDNQYTQAENYAERAYTLAAKNPTIADTYGLSLLRQGKVSEAYPILEKAFQAKSDDPEIALHYAEALIGVGNKNRAKSIINLTNPSSQALIELKANLQNQL